LLSLSQNCELVRRRISINQQKYFYKPSKIFL